VFSAGFSQLDLQSFTGALRRLDDRRGDGLLSRVEG
jgi:hypothetical protein